MTEVYEYCRFRTPTHALRQQPAHWRRMFQDRAAGGGGHGDPQARAAKAVAADRRDGYVLDTGEV